VATYHDESKGSQRGANLISIVEADGLRIAHLGDLGHAVSTAIDSAFVGIDVLLIPVGGHFTIDAGTAAQVVKALNPRIAIPMHFKTDKVGFPIAPVERFVEMMDTVEKPGTSAYTVTKDSLPEVSKVVVLEPAL
jgi:L-ascorbate metabolism protein UlaG (beta-lactamase superfamily)